MNDKKDTRVTNSEGRAGRRNGVSNELVGILTMGVAMIGVSLASWTTLHAEIGDLRGDLHEDMEQLRSDVGDDVQELRADIGALGVSVGKLDERMRAVETRLAVVETHTGSASATPPADLGEA